MKKNLLALCMSIGVIGTTGCDAYTTYRDELTEISISEAYSHLPTNIYDTDIVGVIEDGSITQTSATLIFYNNTDRDYFFGYGFCLEKKYNGEWVSVEPLANFMIRDVAVNLPANGFVNHNIKWEDFGHGILDPGEYRIIKTFMYFRETGVFDDDNITIAVYFNI